MGDESDEEMFEDMDVRKVAETSAQLFLTNDKANVSGTEL
jgi:hypothetical protein